MRSKLAALEKRVGDLPCRQCGEPLARTQESTGPKADLSRLSEDEKRTLVGLLNRFPRCACGRLPGYAVLRKAPEQDLRTFMILWRKLFDWPASEDTPCATG